MTPEGAVRAQLLADAGVSALVGTRVYMLLVPERAPLPAVRVQVISEVSSYHLRGEDGTTPSRVQVDVFARTNADATSVASAVHTALSGRVFTAGGSSDAVQVTGCFRIDRRPMFDADELQVVRILQDYRVWSRAVN